MTQSDLQSLKIDRNASTARQARRKGGWIGWVVLLAIVVALAWLFQGRLREWIDGLRLPAVTTIAVTRQSASAASAISGTSANGYIVAAKKAALSADTPGRVVKLNVTEGSVVKAGDVVAELYADEYRAALDRAEREMQAGNASVLRAQSDVEAAKLDLASRLAEIERSQAVVTEHKAALELARSKLARGEKLLAEKVFDVQKVDDLRTDVVRVQGALDTAIAGRKAADAALGTGRGQVAALEAAAAEAAARVPVLHAGVDLARATLDKTFVRAPFDGIVVLKDAEVGEVVTPNGLGGNARGSVATMVDWKSLEVQVELQETSLAAAVVGELANIYLDAYPDQLYAGRVQRIWPTANRTKATVEVRVGFVAPDERLRPEMGARVVFAPEQSSPSVMVSEPGVVIPRSATVMIDGEPHVFVLERDVVRLQRVQLGDERGGRALVKSGLVGGERIVDAPAVTLGDGDRVRIKE